MMNEKSLPDRTDSAKVESHLDRRARIACIAPWIIIGLLAVALVARVGHYALWTDEATTALTAAGVWRTGDTTALVGDHNLIAYRAGLLLQHFKDRYTPPLQFYLAAPLIGIFGLQPWACRLPFVLCGVGTVWILLLWLMRERPSLSIWVAAALLILADASFLLFQRQCRYYAPATLLSTASVYLYLRWNGRRRGLVALSLLMAGLLATQYLNYAALVICLTVDYGIWGRRRKPLRGMDWLALIGPQLLVAVVVCSIWNPMARAESAVVAAHGEQAHHLLGSADHASVVIDWLTSFWWNARDAMACDFFVLPLLLACPVLWLGSRNPWLLRGPACVLAYLAAIALFTAHPVNGPGNAEVRYLAPLLPLGIAIAILAVREIQQLPPAIGGLVYTASALTIASSAFGYYRELLNPQPEPFTPVAAWVERNVPAGESVYVCPDYAVAPTMVAALKPTYAWQLNDPPRADLAGLPAIQYAGRVAPDYLIGYGPYLADVETVRQSMSARGIRYEQCAVVPAYWKDRFRPELIWRSFDGVEPRAGEMVYVYHRMKSGTPDRAVVSASADAR